MNEIIRKIEAEQMKENAPEFNLSLIHISEPTRP